MTIDHTFFKERQKKYLHFDYPLPSEKIFEYVTDVQNIEKHAFYPFIHFELSSRKIKKKGFKFIKGKKQIIIEKQPPKIREIKYSSHIDGHIYSYYASLLTPNYEKLLAAFNLSDSILAFRKLPNSPNNIHFANTVFDNIKQRQNCIALCFDIKRFFDELDHQILKKAWLKVLNEEVLPKDHYQVFKSITKFSYVNKKDVYQALGLSINRKHKNLKRLCTSQEFRTKIRANKLLIKPNKPLGIPQGSAISAFLSNIYMLEFDINMKNLLSKYNAKYYRYCDDILIICDSKHGLEIDLETQKEIRKLKVQIHPEKTKRVYFKNGLHIYDQPHMSKQPLQYLGFIFDGKKILLRDAGLAKYSHKVMKAIKMTNKYLVKINIARMKRGEPPLERHKKHIYRRFSFIGSRNYISYALRAASIMNEPAIKAQIKPHWAKIQRHIEKHDELNKDFYFIAKDTSTSK